MLGGFFPAEWESLDFRLRVLGLGLEGDDDGDGDEDKDCGGEACVGVDDDDTVSSGS